MNTRSVVRALIVGSLGVGLLVLSGCTSEGDGPENDPSGPTQAATGTGSEAVPWKHIQVRAGQNSQPPLAGRSIALKLLADGSARPGRDYWFTVRIANTGDQPISLDPCPAYRVQYLLQVETGLLNCGEAPSEIPPGGHTDFEMRIHVLRLGKDIGGRYTLLWQLGGEGFEGKTVKTKVPLDPSND
jgi:hypothetical protein